MPPEAVCFLNEVNNNNIYMPETRNSIVDIWGPCTPYTGEWPVRIDEHVTETPDHWVPSACLLCSNGCGIDIGVKYGRIVGVRGGATDRTNHGRLGPKGKIPPLLWRDQPVYLI